MKRIRIALCTSLLSFAAACGGNGDDTTPGHGPSAPMTCATIAPVDEMESGLNTSNLQLAHEYEGHLTLLDCTFDTADSPGVLKIIIYREGTSYSPYFDAPCTTEKTSSVVGETFEIDCSGFPEVDLVSRGEWVRVRVQSDGQMAAARAIASSVNENLLAL